MPAETVRVPCSILAEVNSDSAACRSGADADAAWVGAEPGGECWVVVGQGVRGLEPSGTARAVQRQQRVLSMLELAVAWQVHTGGVVAHPHGSTFGPEGTDIQSFTCDQV